MGFFIEGGQVEGFWRRAGEGFFFEGAGGGVTDQLVDYFLYHLPTQNRWTCLQMQATIPAPLQPRYLAPPPQVTR